MLKIELSKVVCPPRKWEKGGVTLTIYSLMMTQGGNVKKERKTNLLEMLNVSQSSILVSTNFSKEKKLL